MESEAAKGCLGSADAMAEMISCNGDFAAAAPAQCISLRHHRADGVRSMVGGQQTQLDWFKDAARELECDDEQRIKERSGEAGQNNLIEIEDENGALLETVHFSDAVTVREERGSRRSSGANP